MNRKLSRWEIAGIPCETLEEWQQPEWKPCTCGNSNDLLGAVTGLPCAKCTRANHKKALGKKEGETQ
jgi:hypothetical protein